MIAPELLVDWSLGELEAELEEQVETHLFECTACSATAELLVQLRTAVPELARRGLLRLAVTPTLEQRMAHDGLRLRTYDIHPGQSVPCRAETGQHYALTRMHANLHGLERVEAFVEDGSGQPLEHMQDLPFDPNSGVVAIAEMGEVVRAYPTMAFRIRLVGYQADGTRRELGRYGLDHRAG